MKTLIREAHLLGYIVDAMEEGIILTDDKLNVQFMNNAAERILNTRKGVYEGRHFYDDLNLLEVAHNRVIPVIQEVLHTEVAQKGITRRTKEGKHLSINIVPLIENGIKKGLLITAQDITPYVEMENELDLAFALTLPNSKVEYKLKSIVEYKDIYDRTSNKITITGIVNDGGYRHVVNCLKLLSELHKQGITKVIGIDKDQLVNAFIFHDLGKSQPSLKVGDLVDPKEVFEDGKLHAYRGAEIAKHFYNQADDVVEVIRYHHHHEKELPDTFPWRLLPMFRLFQLIDGLSAAMTRGEVKAEFEVHDCIVKITEVNHRPQFNGTRLLDLYTGQVKRLD